MNLEMDRVKIQGHTRTGWDTEPVTSMDEVHTYLAHPHHGEIFVYTPRGEFVLPHGYGRRVEYDPMDDLIDETVEQED